MPSRTHKARSLAIAAFLGAGVLVSSGCVAVAAAVGGYSLIYEAETPPEPAVAADQPFIGPGQRADLTLVERFNAWRVRYQISPNRSRWGLTDGRDQRVKAVMDELVAYERAARPQSHPRDLVVVCLDPIVAVITPSSASSAEERVISFSTVVRGEPVGVLSPELRLAADAMPIDQLGQPSVTTRWGRIVFDRREGRFGPVWSARTEPQDAIAAEPQRRDIGRSAHAPGG